MRIILSVIGIILGLVFISYISVAMFGLLKGSGICKAAGYRDVSLGFPATVYCEKRVNQTDVVIPLSELSTGKPKTNLLQ